MSLFHDSQKLIHVNFFQNSHSRKLIHVKCNFFRLTKINTRKVSTLKVVIADAVAVGPVDQALKGKHRVNVYAAWYECPLQETEGKICPPLV